MATVLTDIGEEFIVDKLIEATQEVAEWFGWGTGAGIAAKADTGVFTPASEAHVQGSSTKSGAGETAKVQVVGSLQADASKTITNFGVFTASGKLIVHVDHAAIGVDAGDVIEYTVVFDPQ